MHSRDSILTNVYLSPSSSFSSSSSSKQSKSPGEEKKREPKKRLSDEAVKKRIDDYVEKHISTKDQKLVQRGRSHERRPMDDEYKKSSRYVS